MDGDTKPEDNFRRSDKAIQIRERMKTASRAVDITLMARVTSSQSVPGELGKIESSVFPALRHPNHMGHLSIKNFSRNLS